MERLDTITHVTGFLQNIDIVTHKCPNTTNIIMFASTRDLSAKHAFRCRNTTNMIMSASTRDLSALTALHVLRALEIHDLNYGSTNFNDVLQGMGHRLTDLKLFYCNDVDLQDVITLCPSLANLFLKECSFSHLNSNTEFDPQLPHFRNVIDIGIYNPVPLI
jgi:hypothetical protein